MLVAVSLGHSQCLGNHERWPVLLALNGLIGLTQATILMFVPESPKYLVMGIKDNDEARKALRKLRKGTDEEIDQELNEIISASTLDEQGYCH